MTESTDRLNRLQSVLAELEQLPTRPPVVVVASPELPIAPKPWIDRCRLLIARLQAYPWTRRQVGIGCAFAVVVLALSLAWRARPDHASASARSQGWGFLVGLAATDPEAASRAASETLSDSSTAADYLNAARVFAAAAAATREELLAEHHAARSVLYLRQAIRLGESMSVAQTDRAFAKIRMRADFRALAVR